MSKLNKALGLRPLWKTRNLLIEFDDAETKLSEANEALEDALKTQ